LSHVKDYVRQRLVQLARDRRQVSCIGFMPAQKLGNTKTSTAADLAAINAKFPAYDTAKPALARVPARICTPAQAPLYVPLESPMGLIPPASALPLAANTTRNLQKLHTDSNSTTVSQRFTYKTDAKWTHADRTGSPPCTLFVLDMSPFCTRRVHRPSPCCNRFVHLAGCRWRWGTCTVRRLVTNSAPASASKYAAILDRLTTCVYQTWNAFSRRSSVNISSPQARFSE